jgi:hypothetical protein
MGAVKFPRLQFGAKAFNSSNQETPVVLSLMLGNESLLRPCRGAGFINLPSGGFRTPANLRRRCRG